MCARRFLLIVFVLILLAVAGAFAIYQYGQQILVKAATPRGQFEAPPAAEVRPDYANAGNWFARPAATVNAALWVPTGVPASRPEQPASVFYVHPTTYLQTDRWNAPLKGNADSDARAELFVRSQASAFNASGDIWAPRYRQAAYGAFLLTSDDATKALDLAYSDVRAAFDAFLRAIPPGQPIILAGHSQGSLHLSRLMAERDATIRDRLVAAYIVGWPLSATADLPKMATAACMAPEQSGCVLSWQSFAEPANPDLILEAWQATPGLNGRQRRRADMVCVNPLTGTADGTAPPAANPGTMLPNADYSQAELLKGVVGARCDRGFLLINGQIPPLGPYVLPGNNYHVYDYALFWAAIREDAQRRLEAWQRR